VGDGVGASCTPEDGADASPEIEEADEVEEGNQDDEDILLPWSRIGDSFEHSG